MIALEEVLAELKSESLNEKIAGDNNNYCLFNSGNYCLFNETQPDVSMSSEMTSEANGQIYFQGLGNQCIV